MTATLTEPARPAQEAAVDYWQTPAHRMWVERASKTRLYADVHRLLRLLRIASAECRRVADGLDDCDPADHPFRDGRLSDGDAPGWQAEDLRLVAAVAERYADGIDSDLISRQPTAEPTRLPAVNGLGWWKRRRDR